MAPGEPTPGLEPGTPSLRVNVRRLGLSRHVWDFPWNQGESADLADIPSRHVSACQVALLLPPGERLGEVFVKQVDIGAERETGVGVSEKPLHLDGVPTL